jgi:hypothetical protein
MLHKQHDLLTHKIVFINKNLTNLQYNPKVPYTTSKIYGIIILI